MVFPHLRPSCLYLQSSWNEPDAWVNRVNCLPRFGTAASSQRLIRPGAHYWKGCSLSTMVTCRNPLRHSGEQATSPSSVVPLNCSAGHRCGFLAFPAILRETNRSILFRLNCAETPRGLQFRACLSRFTFSPPSMKRSMEDWRRPDTTATSLNHCWLGTPMFGCAGYWTSNSPAWPIWKAILPLRLPLHVTPLAYRSYPATSSPDSSLWRIWERHIWPSGSPPGRQAA